MNIRGCDLAIDPIPHETGTLNFITAHNFIEHIPRILATNTTRFPFVELMSEIDRALCSGGLFYSRTPAYPSAESFQDPTHVNIITESTFPTYFCTHSHGGPSSRIYGFTGRFQLVSQRRDGPYLLTLLQKV